MGKISKNCSKRHHVTFQKDREFRLKERVVMLCCKSTLNLWQKLKAPVKNLKVNCDTLPEKRYVFNSGFKPSDKCPRCYQHLGPKLDLFIRGPNENISILLTIAGFIFFFNLVFLIATIVFFFYRCVFASMWFGNQGPPSS